MKGTIFQKPLELQITTLGEKWHQGALLQGEFTITHHGQTPTEPLSLFITIASAEFKSLHAKKADAFEIITQQQLATELVLAPGAKQSFPWSIQLDPNAPITDKNSGLVLCYGTQPDLWQGGHLQLAIETWPVQQEVVRTLEHFYRFKLGAIKSKGAKGTEVKFQAPLSKDFRTLETLTLLMRMGEGDVVSLKYGLKTKALDASSGTLVMEKKSKEITQTIPPSRYLFSKGILNQEGLKQAIDEVLEQVKNRFY